MSKVHLFQRYSSPENVVTNNTLLLLSRIYAYDPLRLETLLGELFDDDVPIGIEMHQQTRGSGSVPDGKLVQEPLQVVIETKVNSGFYADQLKRHLEAFSPGRGNQYLLTIAPYPMPADLKESIQKQTAEFNERNDAGVRPEHLTFQQLIASVQDVLADTDFELQELLADFEQYCAETSLLPRAHFRLRAVPCGDSYKENMEFGVYYEPATRSTRSHRYLGIYRDKAVRGIGVVDQVVEVEIDGHRCGEIAGGELTAEQEERIVGMVEKTRERLGWDIRSGHRFTVVERFEQTEYRKVSKWGMRGMKYFDLGDVLQLDDPISAERAAELLRAHTWE